MQEVEVKANGPGKLSQEWNTEVVPKKGRRRFTREYQLRILKELDEAKHGEAGKILRREGLYSQAVTKWRQQLSEGSGEVKRGRKETPNNELRQKLAKQDREIARLSRKLDQAEKIIEFQKKLSELLSAMGQNEDQK